MEKSTKITIICLIILAIFLTVVYFVVDMFTKDQDGSKDKIEEDNTVYSEEIAINDYLTNLNTSLKQIDKTIIIDSKKVTTQDDTYYFYLYGDINFYIKPKKYTGDMTKEVVEESGIYYSTTSINKDLADKIIRAILLVNKADLKDDEIEQILVDAKAKSETGEEVDKDNGIIIKFTENKEAGQDEYLIRRVYKK